MDISVQWVIDQLGGTAGVRKVCGASTQAIWSWRQRCAIPVRYWRKLVVASNGAVTFEHLADLAERPR
jgi:hypothetical protein